MKTIITSAFIAGALLFSVPACQSKKATKVTPGLTETKPETSSRCGDSVTYIAQVKAIIDNNCALSCHSARSHYAGIDLSTYEMVKAEAQKPRFMGSLNHIGVYSPMPKKSPKLSDSTLLVLSCWIENGYK
jgi:uncharacterized membrane protein